MKFLVCLMLTLLLSSAAYADWPYRSIKIVCEKKKIEVIDYSDYNEQGQARLLEMGVVDVDTLSTWRKTANELNVPDKPLPQEKICGIGNRKYKIILTNQSTGGYLPPHYH